MIIRKRQLLLATLVIALAAAVFARFNSAKVYEFFNKNKAESAIAFPSISFP